MNFSLGVHPSIVELRREASKLLRLISHTDDHQVRQNLARNAFELVRQAEKLRLLEEANQTSREEPPTGGGKQDHDFFGAPENQ
jgi:hypothetical protein